MYGGELFNKIVQRKTQFTERGNLKKKKTKINVQK